MSLERFILFAGDEESPGGGWQDYRGSCHTLDEAIEKAKSLNESWWHVVDVASGKIVAQGRGQSGGMVA